MSINFNRFNILRNISLIALGLFMPLSMNGSESGTKNILFNGDFNRDNNQDGWPDGWRKAPRTSTDAKDGNMWLLFEKKKESSGGIVATQKVDLDSEWTSLNLKAKIRVTGVKQGIKPHYNARTMVTFFDRNNKRVGKWPTVFAKSGTSDWEEKSHNYIIPENARYVIIGFGLWGVGKAECDDLVLTASSDPKLVRNSKAAKTVATVQLKDAKLPKGVKAVWDLSKAYRESSDAREAICINGLWKWRPAAKRETQVPKPNTGWGYYKVPAAWPGINNWLAVDSHKAIEVNGWQSKYNYPKNTMAWYQRDIVVPANWNNKKVSVSMEYLNSYAMVYLDGVQVDEVNFPGGEVDITSLVNPGKKQKLSIFVAAIPLNSDIFDYTAADHNFKRKAKVMFKGLCGDVFLKSYNKNAMLDDIKIATSVKNKELELSLTFKELDKDAEYSLSGTVIDGNATALTIESATFTAKDLVNGRLERAVLWSNPKLWDTHTPQNQYKLQLTLSKNGNKIDQSLPVSFGFREIEQRGRDFFLNGTRIRMFALPIDSSKISGATASYEQVKETLLRLKSIGVNLVYTHNHNCLPGTHISFAETLKAANDVGMLISMSLPHMKDYEWSATKDETRNGYQNHLAWYVKQSQNHPSIIMYSLNHNYAGYKADQDPLRLGTDYMPDADFRGSAGLASKGRRAQAKKSEAIVKRFDTSRLFYNHSSGNMKEMCTLNNYLDFAPSQERSDWFENWAKNGTKPLFLVEYGDPIYANFTFFRGNYKGVHTTFFRKNMMNQYFYPEWGSSFRGDEAYRLIAPEKRRLRFETAMWKKNKEFRSYAYPDHINGILVSENEDLVRAQYLYDNLPAFRTHSVSAYNIWEYDRCWNLREGLDRSEQPLPTDWSNIQRPGYSPDFIIPTLSMPYSYKRSDWILNKRGEAFMRGNNRTLAWLAGSREKFTAKDHNFVAGEKFEKQIIVVNDQRETISCTYKWTLNIPKSDSFLSIFSSQNEGYGTIKVKAGENEHTPIIIDLPNDLATGQYELAIECIFNNGEVQKDSMAIDIIGKPAPLELGTGIALFDPIGDTEKLLEKLNVEFTKVAATDTLDKFEICIIGRKAITKSNALPDFTAVRNGLKVIMFEQTAEVLEKRLGFRVQEHGLRNLFARVPNHDLLKGISENNLRDWRGSATLISDFVKPYADPGRYPQTYWSGYKATRPWRAGNYGSLSSVMINKPVTGDFTPILDGGFSLQYSPLMLYKEGKGSILFCQLDVTGRTAEEPAAKVLLNNILNYTNNYKAPAMKETVLYAGGKKGYDHLSKLGINLKNYTGGTPESNSILVAGKGSASLLKKNKAALKAWFKNDNRIIAVGLTQKEIDALPVKVSTHKKEYISSILKPSGINDALEGVGTADIHNRDPREVLLIDGSLKVDEQGLLGKTSDEKVVFIQLAPWDMDHKKFYNVKPTFRRLSYTLNRVLANSGAAMKTPLFERLNSAVPAKKSVSHLNEYMKTIAMKDNAGKTFLLPTVWKGIPVKEGESIPQNWKGDAFDATNWRDVLVPGPWEQQFDDLATYNGTFLYRVEFDLPQSFTGKDMKIFLGKMDDEDHVYVNGKLIGKTTKVTNPKNYWSVKREYTVPAGLLKAGKNVIAVNINDIWKLGGIFGYNTPDKDRLQIVAEQYGDDMRWMSGFYLTLPVPYDDPYRYFRW